MTPYRAEKEVSVLRADVLLLVERYLSLLESKYSLFLSSEDLLSKAVHSIKTNNFDAADDSIVSHADIIERINLVDFECAAVVQQLSRITGIEDASVVVKKIIIKDKNMIKRQRDILKKINACAVQSEKNLALITDAFEKKISTDSAEVKSLEIIEKLRDRIVLPEK
jgi:hypothetical protein